ncbi:hypothetical protein MMC10_005380 [Thelotrema lepadinum]|nr:hypothetical protein [Thelotrema lepadinum]
MSVAPKGVSEAGTTSGLITDRALSGVQGHPDEQLSIENSNSSSVNEKASDTASLTTVDTPVEDHPHATLSELVAAQDEAFEETSPRERNAIGSPAIQRFAQEVSEAPWNELSFPGSNSQTSIANADAFMNLDPKSLDEDSSSDCDSASNGSSSERDSDTGESDITVHTPDP